MIKRIHKKNVALLAASVGLIILMIIFICASTTNVFAKAGTTLNYVPKTTSRTMDRAEAKSTTSALLDSQFIEIGDKVTLTIDSSSKEYTFDGMDFIDAYYDTLYDVADGNYGLEWIDGETFEGEKAYYHFWAKVDGTKVVSTETVEVTLTGDPLPKSPKSITFTPAAGQYQMIVGSTATPPDQTDDDIITVTYTDDTTEDLYI